VTDGNRTPLALARRQVELDRRGTARVPPLFARKSSRMRRTAHAFFRGCAPLFYEVLAARPALAEGPPGLGGIVGDMHLENVGAFRADSGAVVFDLNDFDDATIGPWRADVLRLAVSTLLAVRSLRPAGEDAVHAVETMTRKWRDGVSGDPGPPRPREVESLLRRAERRTDDDLLAGRAPVKDGRRSFVRGERYLELPAEVASQVPGLLGHYVRSLGERAPKRAGDWRVEDAAWRVAGTGSLGVLRVAVLVSREAGVGDRLFDLKESRPSSVHRAFAAPASEPAVRSVAVVEAARALLIDPPRLLAAVDAAPGFVGRRLFPQEDKLALEDGVQSPEELAREVGWILGRAHRRAATAPPPQPWSDADLSAIVDEAIELAGLFESIYLAYCRLPVT
jgi:uncharacterized protein (DUF2252 family)